MADSEELGRRVKGLMAGLDYREEGERMGLHFTTLYDLAKGRRKSRETMLKFARHFNQDENEWLVLAGHPPMQIRESGADIFVRGLARLCAEFGPVQVHLNQGTEALTPDDARKLLADLERKVRTYHQGEG